MTKICNKCGETKDLSYYSFYSPGKYKSICKECKIEEQRLRDRTRVGKLRRIYRSQKTNSIQRGHPSPAYTEQEFVDRYKDNEEYLRLHSNWIRSGYDRLLAPSLDRGKNNEPYTFSNLQLCTLEDNGKNYYEDIKAGKVKSSNWEHKPVNQYNLSGKFIATHISVGAAARSVGGDPPHITNVCRQEESRHTHKGYIWRYKDD